MARFHRTIYRCSPSALVEADRVRIAGHGSEAALLAITNTASLEPGSEYRFEVQQKIGEKVVGGSTYIVRIAGEKKRTQPSGLLEEDFERIARMRPDFQ